MRPSSTTSHEVQMMHDPDLVRRAMAGYWRFAPRTAIPRQASTVLSEVLEYAGKRYVVLRNVSAVIAIYRVQVDGQLKRLKRWPRVLEGED